VTKKLKLSSKSNAQKEPNPILYIFCSISISGTLPIGGVSV